MISTCGAGAGGGVTTTVVAPAGLDVAGAAEALDSAVVTGDEPVGIAAELAASELRNQLTATGPPPQGLLALREQLEGERRARQRLERAAKDAQLQLTQEKYTRDSTERALKQVQDRLEQTQDRLAAASCWACPSGAPCSKPM